MERFKPGWRERRLIVSFGSVNADIAAYPRRLPRPGETVQADHYAISLGGKGANQAAAAGRLARDCELRATFHGCTGQDAFGDLVRKELGGFGVELGQLRADPAETTGLALIGVDEAGENSIVVCGAANMSLGAADVMVLSALLGEAALLLLQLEIPLGTVQAAAEAGRRAGAFIVLDPAPVPGHGLPEALLRAVDILTPNETETALLTGIAPDDAASAAAACERLVALGAAGAIIKLGARGAYFRFLGAEGFQPAFAVASIDTVAAGDVFNAGLAVALALGEAPAGAVRFAAACGALATTRRGAARAAPFRAEVEALLRG